MVEPTAETWCMSEEERNELEAMEIKCLRSVCAATKVGRVKDEAARGRVGVKKKMRERVGRKS